MIKVSLLLIIISLAACGTKSTRSSGDPNQTDAERLGITLAEYRTLVDTQKSEFSDAETAKLRPVLQRSCRPLREKPKYGECLVQARAVREVMTERRDALVAADPLGACTEARVEMGQSRSKARDVCAGFSRACQEEYATRYWIGAHSVQYGLIGAEGKGYWRCKATGERLFAGAAVPNTTVEQLFSDRTSMSYDPCHQEQIEYNAPDGRSYLWYGNNKTILRGLWEIVTNNNDPRISIRTKSNSGTPMAQYCQKYEPGSYNPSTRQSSGRWECLPLFLIAQNTVAGAAGDVFGLAEASEVPGRLRGNVPSRFKDFANPYPGGVCRDGRVIRGSASSTE